MTEYTGELLYFNTNILYLNTKSSIKYHIVLYWVWYKYNNWE